MSIFIYKGGLNNEWFSKYFKYGEKYEFIISNYHNDYHLIKIKDRDIQINNFTLNTYFESIPERRKRIIKEHYII